MSLKKIHLMLDRFSTIIQNVVHTKIALIYQNYSIQHVIGVYQYENAKTLWFVGGHKRFINEIYLLICI